VLHRDKRRAYFTAQARGIRSALGGSGQSGHILRTIGASSIFEMDVDILSTRLADSTTLRDSGARMKRMGGKQGSVR